jgi:lauroyl/myristoyl acyltransferase
LNCTRTAFANAIKIFSHRRRYDTRMVNRAADGGRVVRSEARGGHWVAWIPDEHGKPENSVVLVGETRDEAEERARAWAERGAPR